MRTQVYEEAPVALALVLRHRHDAAQVVAHREARVRVLLLREVAHQVCAEVAARRRGRCRTRRTRTRRAREELGARMERLQLIVPLHEHVEQERLHIVVERLVVEEELREQTQLLAVALLQLPVHLEHRQRAVLVDLVARRVPHRAFLHVALELLLCEQVVQTELADVQSAQPMNRSAMQ